MAEHQLPKLTVVRFPSSALQNYPWSKALTRTSRLDGDHCGSVGPSTGPTTFGVTHCSRASRQRTAGLKFPRCHGCPCSLTNTSSSEPSRELGVQVVLEVGRDAGQKGDRADAGPRFRQS